ncbi:sensor histidine kinase [Pimelobacter simplex]|uniref:sensor histidine kinase n=1 Tax=Nocardioides simplex TaxID=2045 RepID=UPI00366D2ADA
MSRPPAWRWITAGLVVVTSWGLAGASVVIAWAFQLPAAPVPGTFLASSPPEAQAHFDDIGVTVAFVYAPLAAVLLLRRPHPVAVVMAVHAVGSGLAAFGVQYGLLAAERPGLPGGGFLAYAGGWGFVPGTFLTAIVPVLLLPDPARLLRRVLVPVVAVATAIAALTSLTHQSPGMLRNPLAPDWPAYQAAAQDIYAVAAGVTLMSSVGVVAVLVRRLRAASPDLRSPLRWLLVGHVFLTASYLVTVLPASLQLAAPVWAFATIAPIVGQIFYPSAILVMGLQHRLRGVDVAVSTVLTTSIVAVLAASGYYVTVTVLEYAGEASAAAGFTTAAVIAVALLPAHNVIQHRVDRLVYGEAGAPERLVADLGAQVGEIATGDDGVRALAAALRTTLQLGSVHIGPASDADLPEPVVSFSLDQRDDALLVVTGPAGGLPIGRRTREAIGDLTPVIGAVVRLAAAATARDAARALAADARHAERRALRRELHDGLGPALSGAAFSVAAAANLLSRGDRPGAVAAVARVQELLETQAATLANLAVGGPAPVRDLGRALDQLVTSFAGAGPRLHLDATGEIFLDPHRAGIVHRIASEAVHNAVRHAEAATVTVTLGAVPGEVLRVRDDGRGISGTVGSGGAGVGLSSMHEWAAEAGLECRVSAPEDGGTLVVVRLTRKESPMSWAHERAPF